MDDRANDQSLIIFATVYKTLFYKSVKIMNKNDK